MSLLRKSSSVAVFVAAALAIVVSIWYVDFYDSSPGGFRWPVYVPEPGHSFVVRREFIGAKEKDDVKYTMQPLSEEEPDLLVDMLEDGDAIMLQPGERFVVREYVMVRKPLTYARIDTPHGELWTQGVFVTNKFISERVDEESSGGNRNAVEGAVADAASTGAGQGAKYQD